MTLDDGIIIDCSVEFTRLTGFPKSAIVKHPITLFSFSGSEIGWGLKRLDLELLQHSGRYEDVGLTTPDKISMISDIWVSHISHGDDRWALCLVTDKSPQRQLQGELIAKHKELKRAFHQLEERTGELEEARDALKRKNRNISDLSAQSRATGALATIGEITAELTHQLNNPLAAATGACRKLTKLNQSGRTEEFAPMLQLLSTSLHRLKETIDEVHIIYRQSRMPTTPKSPIRVRDQLDATLALLEQQLEGLTVLRQIPSDIPDILGHPSLFQHVIINLLDNAIEASGAGGTLEIVARQDGDRVAISISDTGPGIPPHLREKIFEAFYSLKEGGSGLGLAAVKRYVERDKATIEVGESKLGGAQFTICYWTTTSGNDAERKA